MSRYQQRDDEIDLREFTNGSSLDELPLDSLISSKPDGFGLLPVKCTSGDERVFSFALYADGACLGNGTAEARASVGVYGTDGAWYNEGSLLPPYLPQTNQSAEIYSAIAAVKIVRAIHKEYKASFGECVRDSVVVLLMDSTYVVDAMTCWIRKWRENGFLNARGSPVVNGKAFKRLDHDIKRAKDDRNIIVCFRHVPREYNSGADRMAKQAFLRNRVLDLSRAKVSYSDYDSDDSQGYYTARMGMGMGTAFLSRG